MSSRRPSLNSSRASASDSRFLRGRLGCKFVVRIFKVHWTGSLKSFLPFGWAHVPISHLYGSTRGSSWTANLESGWVLGAVVNDWSERVAENSEPSAPAGARWRKWKDQLQAESALWPIVPCHSRGLSCVCRKLTSSEAKDAGGSRITIRQVMMLNHLPLRANEIGPHFGNRFPALSLL